MKNTTVNKKPFSKFDAIDTKDNLDLHFKTDYKIASEASDQNYLWIQKSKPKDPLVEWYTDKIMISLERMNEEYEALGLLLLEALEQIVEEEKARTPSRQNP